MSKKRIARVELLIIEVGIIAEQLEANLISMETAQEKTTSLFKEAIQGGLIAPSNVEEIMSVDRETIEYLRNKHYQK